MVWFCVPLILAEPRWNAISTQSPLQVKVHSVLCTGERNYNYLGIAKRSGDSSEDINRTIYQKATPTSRVMCVKGSTSGWHSSRIGVGLTYEPLHKVGNIWAGS